MEKLTKQQFRSRFADTKVYVDGKSEEIQVQFAKAGIEKDDSFGITWDMQSPFLYVGKVSEDCILYTGGNRMQDFSISPMRKVAAEEILNIEIVEDEPQFKLKDEVVARCFPCTAWFHGHFSNIDPSNKTFKYVLSGGLGVQECLPFNEKTAKLIGTTDNWKEDEL